ncbi:alanine racemase [Roseimaritima sediminicola]|uniref:alanine racemase n=1 Tax=Roseimaritima sediminicola TaxID=2662066 RepID=UPI0013875B0C|nr:alanine racemase [Roseimaritima sediminicola]
MATPALLIDADRVDQNIRLMLQTVGDRPDRLRPHVKTHKMSAVVQQYLKAGIRSFKAATLEEAAMAAAAGAADVLLAHQPVGEKQGRWSKLIQTHRSTRFSTIVDDLAVVDQLGGLAESCGDTLDLWIDVDCGMHRTGIAFGAELQALRERIRQATGLRYRGLHVYDGHLHQPSLEQRKVAVEAIARTIEADLRSDPAPEVVVGGSPTFALWAERLPDRPQPFWQCSPGTMVFWDWGYDHSFAEMPYEIAATVLTSVISKPASGRLCLDLGHKSLASEMPLELRAAFPALPDARLVGHSEEHLVIESEQAEGIAVGETLVALPRHICPTVNLYGQAAVVRDRAVTEEAWAIT